MSANPWLVRCGTVCADTDMVGVNKELTVWRPTFEFVISVSSIESVTVRVSSIEVGASVLFKRNGLNRRKAALRTLQPNKIEEALSCLHS